MLGVDKSYAFLFIKKHDDDYDDGAMCAFDFD
jgi:hypothetical protein